MKSILRLCSAEIPTIVLSHICICIVFFTGCSKNDVTVTTSKSKEIEIADNSYIQDIVTQFDTKGITISEYEDPSSKRNYLTVLISTQKNIDVNKVDWFSIAEKFVKSIGIYTQYDSLNIMFQNYTNNGYYERNSQVGYTYTSGYVDSVKRTLLTNDINDYTIMRQFLDKDQWKELDLFTDSLLTNPTKNIVTFINKARVQINKKEYVPAMNNLLEALRRNPNINDANYLMGVAYAGRENYTEAMQCYKKVIERVPDWPPAHTQLAEMYQKLGMKSEEKAERELAEKLSGEN
ncbi:MAG: tetratricopeptide repeat protein [Candidatus Kapabacteria bacterium]|nr:tetratricopeptide repeat protein [Candidatus Kapabacteria bacterium]